MIVTSHLADVLRASATIHTKSKRWGAV